jgi:hypothetical protein
MRRIHFAVDSIPTVNGHGLRVLGNLIEFCDPSLGFTVAVFDGPRLERTLTFCQQAKNDCLERFAPRSMTH